MTTGRENLIRKCQHLMAKTVEAGCTEAEAMASLARVNAMMAAYDISEEELNLTKEEKAILRREPPGAEDPNRIKQWLYTAVAEFCNCQGWRDMREKSLAFCGLRADVGYATFLLDSLTRFVQAELVEHLCDAMPSTGERRGVIRSFVLGCTGRISKTLHELAKQREATTAATPNTNARALVKVQNQAIAAKMEELEIYLTCRGSGPAGPSDSASYSAGQAAGGRASFARPVSGRGAVPRLGKH